MRTTSLALSAALLFSTTATEAQEEEKPEFIIIVHADNPLDAMSREDVSRLMLRKKRTWPDEQTVKPIGHADAALQSAFARKVHHKEAFALKAYWQQQIFSGRGVPPPNKKTDDVIAFVRSEPGAIGYVPRGTKLEGVKELTLK